MMIEHIVLFKFKPTTTKAQIDACFIKLHELAVMLSIIESYRWGDYSSHENLNQGFNHGFVMTFANAQARNEYLAHPDHIKVAEFIQQHLDFPSGVIAFDSTLNNIPKKSSKASL